MIYLLSKKAMFCFCCKHFSSETSKYCSVDGLKSYEDQTLSKQARYNCIFDCELKESNLVSLIDKESWDSLENAAKLHKRHAILRIAADIVDNRVPTIIYRSNRTVKTTQVMNDCPVTSDSLCIVRNNSLFSQ